MELLIYGYGREAVKMIARRHFKRTIANGLDISERQLGTRIYVSNDAFCLTDGRLDILRDHKKLLGNHEPIVYNNRNSTVTSGPQVLSKVFVTDLPFGYRVIYPEHVAPEDMPNYLIQWHISFTCIMFGCALCIFLQKKHLDTSVLANLLYK